MAKIGFKYISLFLGLALVFFFYGGGISGYIIGGLFFLLTLFCLYFFRDPVRNVRIDENKILSPADGTIFEISDVDEPLFIKGRTKVIKIFLSVLNVHLQRSPIAGDIKFIQTQEGLVLPANHKDASEKNQQNLVGIINGKTQILIRQIAGIIAQKCDLWIQLNQKVEQGDKLGIIHFGSQVDIYFPSNIKVNVEVGQKVVGGITVLGTLIDANIKGNANTRE
ncbi:MAG: phosphatidylserine decarboxylase family protein [Elusimicrobia bacterium]|nr:phosphatidylserine decarboxylase family protein [Elusimicrobiota bacterium]